MKIITQIGGFFGFLMVIVGAISLVNKLTGAKLGIKHLGAVPGDYVTAAFLLTVGAVFLGIAVAVNAKTQNKNT